MTGALIVPLVEGVQAIGIAGQRDRARREHAHARAVDPPAAAELIAFLWTFFRPHSVNLAWVQPLRLAHRGELVRRAPITSDRCSAVSITWLASRAFVDDPIDLAAVDRLGRAGEAMATRAVASRSERRIEIPEDVERLLRGVSCAVVRAQGPAPRCFGR